MQRGIVMDKCAFLKTAIEVLKYDDGFKKIPKRENLIKLLSRWRRQ